MTGKIYFWSSRGISIPYVRSKFARDLERAANSVMQRALLAPSFTPGRFVFFVPPEYDSAPDLRC